MTRQPDLVLFMTDQQRSDQVGFAGGGLFDTPTLDALAARGTVFDNAYSASTTCVPARAALLTGLQHHRIPRQGTGLALQEGFWTVAHALRAAGYQTALVGKMHFSPIRASHGFETMRICEDLTTLGGYTTADTDDYHDWLVEAGIADWRALFQPASDSGHQSPLTGDQGEFPYEAEVHPTSWVASEARTVLRTRDPLRPLFLVVSFPNPHAPYNPPEPYASMYEPADAPVPASGFEVNSRLPASWRALLEERSGSRVRGQRGLRLLLTKVRALIRHIDDAMSSVLADIDLSSTSVFFTSDHGDYAGHRGLMKKTPWIPFDDLAKVALVAAGAGIAEGRRAGALVQNSDLPLTFLDLAGVEPPAADFDSRSLRPLLEGEAGERFDQRPVFSCTSLGFPMVRLGAFKCITRDGRDDPLLFHVVEDADETTNLSSGDYEDIRRELTRVLADELALAVPKLPRFGP